ncbi:MAG: hypothetical protein JWN23_2037 [Rhodocyclales bacterium]|nr:hypothetical protein [Rhodocyclales bacterium]
MKILVVIPTVFGGGAEQVAAILSREWSLNHDVRVLAWQSAGGSLDFGVSVVFTDLGVQQGLLRKLRNVWRRVRKVSEEIRCFRPDVIMAFMDEAGMPCVVSAGLNACASRLIVSVHHNPQWLPRWRRALLGLFYRHAGAVVAVSEGVRGELAGALRIPQARLHHIPNSLVTGAQVVDADPESLSMKMQNGYVLAVGRLDRHTKGFDVLTAAYAALPAPRPGLVIVGDGPDRGAIEEDIARAGIGSEVVLTGWVRDPRPFYRAASLFVLASRYEGWSNVLMEAMGEGCLVVAARCPYGPPEILGDELAEWLVAPGDAAALTQCMQKALSLNDVERNAVSSALHVRVQRFAADKVAARWIELARSLCAPHEQASS